MKKFNIHTTEEFENNLARYMRERGIATKAEALRQALREAIAINAGQGKAEFRDWLGLGLRVPPRREVRFKSEDDLWSFGPRAMA